MRIAGFTAALVTSTLAVACKDTDGGSAAEETGTSEPTSTTGESTGAQTTNGTAEVTSASSGSSSESGPSEVTLSGEILDYVANGPIAGAQISLYQMAGFETVSAEDGSWAISGLAPSMPVVMLVDVSTEYFGSVRPVTVGATDTEDVALAQVPFQFVQDQYDLLGMQGAQPLDQDAAAIIVRLIQNTATGTTIELAPPPAPDTYFAPGSNGNPILNSNVVEFGLLPVVVFANLPPAESGAYEVSASHPERECTVVHPEFPTLGTHITLVDVDCPPPG